MTTVQIYLRATKFRFMFMLHSETGRRLEYDQVSRIFSSPGNVESRPRAWGPMS